ncbi:MAG: thioesterase II family protein [Acidimicrobiia bacterium]
MLCLPHAGGSPAFFRAWPARLPGVDVVPVQLPGRGARFSEPAHDSLLAAARAIGDAIEPLLDRPYAVFGHCLGAWLGFEVVRRIRRQRLPEPVHLFVSAALAPHLSAAQPRLSDLPGPAFRDAVLALGGTGEAVAANDELLDLLLPVVRTDFRLAETYRVPDEPPLSCPVTVFAGQQDQPTTEGFEAWERHTTGTFRLVTLPGGHFFVDHELPRVLAAVGCELEDAFRRATPGKPEEGS